MSSETNILTCEYCSQILVGKTECDCKDARRARKIADQISRASLAIRDIFGTKCTAKGYTPVADEHIELMDNIAALIANHKIHTASLTLISGTKAKLTRGAKGAIKVERSETKKSSTEVEE